MNEVFLGYFPKTPYRPQDVGVDWGHVTEICCISGCISNGVSFDEGSVWWTRNKAMFYNSEDDAAKAGVRADGTPCEIMAAWLYPFTFSGNGIEEAIDLETFFNETGLLPEREVTGNYKAVGYDIVAFVRHEACDGWNCSPLTCNGYGGSDVNQYGLIDELERARQMAQTIRKELPEPDEFLIIRVGRRHHSAEGRR